MKACVALVTEAHRKMMPRVPLIGWDVAITKEHGAPRGAWWAVGGEAGEEWEGSLVLSKRGAVAEAWHEAARGKPLLITRLPPPTPNTAACLPILAGMLHACRIGRHAPARVY